MAPRLIHYSDIENAYDYPERISRLAGTIDLLQGEDAIVVGTGDNTAPGVLAEQYEGRQALDFFRAVEPAMETFGNHDFDFGLEATRELIADSPQPWICANVYNGDDRFAGVSPWMVVKHEDERIGLIGVTDPTLPEITPAAAEVTTTDPVEAVADELPSLRRAADHVVVLAHLRPDDEHAIAEFDAVSAILGGHVHTERHERVAGTLLLRPMANGRTVWEVKLGEEVRAIRHDVAEGAVADSVATSLRNRMAEVGLSEVVGEVTNPIDRSRERRYGGECRIANLVTDAYRWVTDADVGFVLTGSIRDGPSLEGEVTVADIVGVSPFAGDLCIASLDGGELYEMVDGILAPIDATHDRIWRGQFSGMRVIYDPNRRQVQSVTVNGETLDSSAEYTVATNRYVAVSGSDLTPITSDHITETWGVQYDAILKYARETPLDVRLDGRIEPTDD